MTNKELLELNSYLTELNNLQAKLNKTAEDIELINSLQTKIEQFYPHEVVINIFNTAFLEIDNIKSSNCPISNVSKVLLEIYSRPTADVNKIDILTDLTHTLIMARLNNEMLTTEEINNIQEEMCEKPLKLELKKNSN